MSSELEVTGIVQPDKQKRKEHKKIGLVQKGFRTVGAIGLATGALLAGPENVQAQGPDATPTPITTTVKPEGPKPTPTPTQKEIDDAFKKEQARIKAESEAILKEREKEKQEKEERERRESQGSIPTPENSGVIVSVPESQGQEATQLWEDISEGKGQGSKPKEGIDLSLANWPAFLLGVFFAWRFGLFKLIGRLVRRLPRIGRRFSPRSQSGSDDLYTR